MRKKNTTRFEVIAQAINFYLRQEDLSLNFDGYRETIRSYQRVADNHLAEVYDLMVECLLWSNYMYEVRSFIEYKKEEALLKQDYYLALEERANPSQDLEKEIQEWKQRVKNYKLFEKHLIAQYKFFIKAYEQCKTAYRKGAKEIGEVTS